MIGYYSPTGDVVALVFFAIALLVPFLAVQSKLRGDEVLVITLGTLARCTLSLLSANGVFLSPIADSLEFHSQASEIALTWTFPDIVGPGVPIFTSFVAVFYGAFGTSILLADAIGSVAFSFSCIVLTRIGRELWPGMSFAFPLLLFAFGPAMLLYGNFNYREPFQILFLVAATYCAIRYRKQANALSLAGMTFFLLLFASIHGRFIVVVPILLVLTVIYPVYGTTQHKLRLLPGTALAASAAIAIFLWMGASLTDNKVAQALTTGALDSYIEEFGSTALAQGGRTMLPYYPTGGAVDLLSLAPLLLIQYLFAPAFPWIVLESQDLVALTDTLLRMLVLIASATLAFSPDKRLRNDAWFLLLFYLTFSMVAAFGTWTVGTAMRHQIKASWILLVLGGPVVRGWIQGLSMRPVATR